MTCGRSDVLGRAAQDSDTSDNPPIRRELVGKVSDSSRASLRTLANIRDVRVSSRAAQQTWQTSKCVGAVVASAACYRLRRAGLDPASAFSFNGFENRRVPARGRDDGEGTMKNWNVRRAITPAEAIPESERLHRSLSWPHLVALGVGAIVGKGILTLTGVGADRAGPAGPSFSSPA